MRILFFGLPLAAVLLEADGHRIVHAALCRSGAPGERRLRRSLGGAVELRPDLTAPAVVERLRRIECDLLVSWFWTTRIPRALLEAPRLGTLGVHPSLLPRHRGPDPYFWALDAGDAVTGVTAHALAEDYDTGAIYGQTELPIDASWNAWTLARRLDHPSLALLRATAARFARGEVVASWPQDPRLVTLAPAPDDDLLELDFRRTAVAVERRVRAAAPTPGAYTHLGDEPVTLTRVRALAHAPKALLPGEAFAVARAGDVVTHAAVCCGEGAVELLEGYVDGEGGGLTVLDAAALARLALGSPDV